MPGDDIGSAYVTIRPRLDSFHEELTEELESATAGTDQRVPIHIDADDDDFMDKVVTDRKVAESFGNQKYRPTFESDDADLRASLDEIQERAKALANESFKLKVSGDTSEARDELVALRQQAAELETEAFPLHVTADGVARVSADLDDLEVKLDEYGSRKVSAKVEVDGADKASADLDKAGKSADTTSDGMSKLISAAIAVGPALIPISAAAVVALGGVAVLAGSAAAGLGAFALAASGDLSQVEGSAKAMIAAFQQENQATVLPVLQGAIRLIPQALGDIEPLVTDTASALSHFEGVARTALGSNFWESFFQLLGGQGKAAISTFGNLLGGTGTALAGLDRAFAPVITDIEGGLDRMAAAETRFGLTAGSNSGLQSFIAYVEKEGPQVLQVLGVLGGDLLTLTEDAGKLGPSFLSIIGGAGELLGDLENLSPQLVEVAVAALSAYKAFSVLAPAVGVIKDLSNIGTLFSGSTGADEAASGLGRAAAAAGQFRTSIYEAAAASINADASFLGLGAAASEFSGLVTAASEEVAASLKGVDVAAAFAASSLEDTAVAADVAGEGIGIGLDAALGPIGLVAIGVTALIALFGHTSDAAKKLGESLGTDFSQDVGDSIPAMTAAVARLTAQNAALQDSTTQTITVMGRFGDTTETVSDATDAQRKTMSENAGEIDELNKKLSDARDSQQALGQATLYGGQATQALAEKLAEAVSPAQRFQEASAAIAGALKSESSDATSLTNALNVLTGTYLSAQGAVIQQRQAVDSFGDALKAAKGNLDGNSEASLAAQQSANSFAASLYTQLIPALAKNGDSAAQITQITGGTVAAFDAAAAHAGLTAGQIAQLNATYALTPKQVSTAIAQTGASGVIQQADAAKAALDALNGTFTSTISVILHESGVGAAQTAIHSIHSNAQGTDNFVGGLSWVGEQGPELMSLPTGTKIVSNPKSMGLVAAGHVSAPGFAAGLNSDALFSHLNVNVAPPNTQAYSRTSGNDVEVGLTGGKLGGSTAESYVQAFLAGLHPLTPGIVASLAAGLDQEKTAAENAGIQIIDAFTKTTNALKGGKSETVSLSADAIVPKADIDAIAARLPKSIGEAVEKAGPLTTSELKALFRKLNETLTPADFDSIAKRLPNEIVDELRKAGPLTVAEMKSLADGLTKTLQGASADISKGLGGSIASLTTYVGDAKAAVDKTLKGTSADSVIDSLAGQFDYLSTKAKNSLAAITTQLGTAQAAVKSIQSQTAQNASGLEGQFSILTAPATTNGWTPPITGASIITSLQTDVASLRTYRSLLDTLKSWGLSEDLLQQLVTAGPAAGLASARALVAGGRKEVNLADVLQGRIDSTSTQIGGLSAVATLNGKQVGLAQATGIVDSLEKSKAQITAELNRLADDMQLAIRGALDITGGSSKAFVALGDQIMDGLREGIHGSRGGVRTELEDIAKDMEEAIKKALGIKSPSSVFAAVGTNLVEGLVQGITGSAGLANSAIDNLLDGAIGKSKSKALSSFDHLAVPVGLGDSGAAQPGQTVSYSPQVTIQGEVGPKTVALVSKMLDDDRNELVRLLPTFR